MSGARAWILALAMVSLILPSVGTRAGPGGWPTPRVEFCEEALGCCREASPREASRWIVAASRIAPHSREVVLLTDPWRAVLDRRESLRLLRIVVVRPLHGTRAMLVLWQAPITATWPTSTVLLMFGIETGKRNDLRFTYIGSVPRFEEDLVLPSTIDLNVAISEQGAPVAHVRAWYSGMYVWAFEDFLLYFWPVFEIVPISERYDFRSGTMEDLDGRPPPELSIFDVRWKGYFVSGGHAGPWVTTILKVDKGRFALACTDYPQAYRPRLARLEAEIREALRTPDLVERLRTPLVELTDAEIRFRTTLAELMLEQMLNAIQAGLFDEAKRAFARLEGLFESMEPVERALVQPLLADFERILTVARRSGSPCPLARLTPPPRGNSFPLDYTVEWLRNKARKSSRKSD